MENNIFIHQWTDKNGSHSIRYHLSYNVFTGLYYALLLGGEFPNMYGHGDTPDRAVESLKFTLVYFRRKRTAKNK
jgi:hypothetical protein